MEISHNHTDNSIQIPLSERRSPATMGLVWVTMVTAFPTVLIGFEWFKQGFSLTQVLFCSLISCLLLLAYSIPVTQLGAKTGLGYCALSRSVFGRWGTWLITANLLCVFLAWYGMTAVWMAEAIRDFLHVNVSIMWLSILFSFVMAFNNFFGFSGVANFARYFAAPAMIAWVAYTFFKSVGAAPSTVMSEPSHVPMLNALTAISTFVIGYSVWGNEADYWRFAKTGVTRALAPLAVALLIGEVLFPTAGWLVARTTGVVDAAAATAFMNNYSFAGLAVVALTILTASYFAVNDSGMFGSSTALESLWPIKHRVSVTIVATAGAIAAAFLSLHDSTKALEVIASLNCIFAPTPTVIVLTEWFLRAKIFHSMEDMSYVPSFNQLPRIIWPAALAFLLGITAGVATSGLIPALEFIHAGIPPVFAWITAATVYSCLRIFQHRREMADQKIILESSLARTRQSESLIGSKGKR